MQRIRPSTLSSFSRKISYVFLFCGLFLCYLVVSMRNATIEAMNNQQAKSYHLPLQVPDEIKHPIPPPSFDNPLPPGNVRPIQELLMQQAKDQMKPKAPAPVTGMARVPVTDGIARIMATTQITTDMEPAKITNGFAPAQTTDTFHQEQGEQASPMDTIDMSVETEDGELKILKSGQTSPGNSGIYFKDFKCGTPNTKLSWCTVDHPEDLMQIKLPPFLKDYKNPCWKVKVTDGYPSIRCLPYFFLIGAPKSGTTDLFERMIKHPQISSLVKKEIHWFSRRRYAPRDSKSIPQHPMFSNYTDMFKQADADLLNSVDTNGYHYKVFGDSSVSTLWDNMNAVRYSIMTKTQVPRTAECIHHLNPNTKFVSIIRDPVERTYSDFLYFGNFPDKSKESFHHNVLSAINFHKECVKHYSLQDCIDYRTSNVSRARLWVGIYHHHFEEFFKFFSKEQFIILKLEDYSAKMPENLAKVFSFLGLDSMSDAQMRNISDQSNIYNTRPSSGVKLGDMWPETRMLLDDFFRPYNDELGRLLGTYYNYNKK